MIDFLIHILVLAALAASAPVWLWLIAAILQRIPYVQRLIDAHEEQNEAA